MWRENRRVQAMSWGSNGSDEPPPKPSRVPAALVGANTSRTGSVSSTEQLTGPTTYLVAPNSEVLAQLMRDNENRADAGLYTAPALAFNTFTVEFVHSSAFSSTVSLSPQHKLKVKGRKQQHPQPEYANLVSTAAAAGTAEAYPEIRPVAPEKDVRLAWTRSNSSKIGA